MSKSTSANETTILYQAAPGWSDQTRKIRHHLSIICGQCQHRKVRVQTVDGTSYEGIVLGTDGCHLHLLVGPETRNPYAYGYDGQSARFFGPFGASSILTLVLYELLVIALLA
jgi:hypothetical protein